MNLTDQMEFDHPVAVQADGTVTDAPEGIYAPEVEDGELVSYVEDWTLLSGYTGQQSYNGPVMHNSEYIGGRLERDILAEPGIYVAVVNAITWDCDDPECTCTDGPPEVEGWCIARRVMRVDEDEAIPEGPICEQDCEHSSCGPVGP